MKLDTKMALAANGLAVVLAALTLLASATADAATLIGDVIAAEYDQPAIGSNKCTSLCFSPKTFTVQPFPFIESTGSVASELIDFTDHALTITFISHANFGAPPFNGFVFTVLSGNPFDVVGSVSGIASSLVSEPNGLLAINLSGLVFDDGSQIVVTFGAPVATPLPGALPLFAGSLGAMGLLGWRRRRKNG